MFNRKIIYKWAMASIAILYIYKLPEDTMAYQLLTIDPTIRVYEQLKLVHWAFAGCCGITAMTVMHAQV